jgi:hypothetical protein
MKFLRFVAPAIPQARRDRPYIMGFARGQTWTAKPAML